MTDYFGVFLAGISTGAGVIVAQKLMAWVETHPFTKFLSQKARKYTIDEWEEICRRRKH